MAFNLFSGTGYFLFSGISNFGDWAGVIAGLHPYWLWRVFLVMLGAAALVFILVLGPGIQIHR